VTSQPRRSEIVPLHGPVREEWIADLHRSGRSRNEVWTLWLLDAFRVLSGHLAEDGEVLADNGSATPHYLTPDEWLEVMGAARTVSDLACSIETALRYPQ